VERVPGVLALTYSEARGLLEPLRNVQLVTIGTVQEETDMGQRRVVRQRDMGDVVELVLGSSSTYVGDSSD